MLETGNRYGLLPSFNAAARALLLRLKDRELLLLTSGQPGGAVWCPGAKMRRWGAAGKGEMRRGSRESRRHGGSGRALRVTGTGKEGLGGRPGVQHPPVAAPLSIPGSMAWVCIPHSDLPRLNGLVWVVPVPCLNTHIPKHSSCWWFPQ